MISALMSTFLRMDYILTKLPINYIPASFSTAREIEMCPGYMDTRKTEVLTKQYLWLAFSK